MAKKSSTAGGTSLVIVESPAKARTISKFLGRGYTIEASIGHIRDLPQGAKEIPEQYKKEEWAYLGVNVNHDFEPVYVIPREKTPAGPQAQGPVEGRQGTLPGDGRRPRGRGHQLAPVRGAAAEGAGAAAGVPRDHRGGDPRCAEEPPRDRRAPGPGPGSPPHRRPPVRLRRFPAVVAEDPPAALGGPRAKRGRAADRRARTAADGLRAGHVLGPAGDLRQAGRRVVPGGTDLGRRPPHPRQPRFRSGHRPTEGCRPAAVGRASGRRSWPSGFAAPTAAWPTWKTSPTPPGPIRPLPPARCNRRRTASTASPPGTRCRWPRRCTRRATSPTCEPTRPPWPRWRSTPRGNWWPRSTATSICRPRRGSIRPRSRTPRRPTRRFGPPAIRSIFPSRSAGGSAPTSSSSTT